MFYGITDLTINEIQIIINDLYCQWVDTDTDVYFLLLFDELECRLPEDEFLDFCELF